MSSTEELFREHARFVARFLVTLGVRAMEVEDLVQDVFVVVHRKGFVEMNASPRTYLAAIAVRTAKAHFRKRRFSSLDDEKEIASLRRPDVDAENAESLLFVRRALEGLSDEKRAAFVLYEIEGETSESIARAFGVPVGTIYSRLHHARREFLEALARFEKSPRDLKEP